MLFCCEQALKKKPQLLFRQGIRNGTKTVTKIDVNPHAPFTSEEEREATKERAEARWVDNRRTLSTLTTAIKNDLQWFLYLESTRSQWLDTAHAIGGTALHIAPY